MEQLARGATVGRFSIIRRIGAGGMSVVYSAYDPELDRKVAIKLMHSRQAGGTTGARARLIREAQAMARVSHPNVIVVYEVGTVGDQVFLAEELVEGTTLHGWMKSQSRSWRETLDVFLLAGRGLAAAHAAGVIHRDFKPLNVLIGTDGRVRVTDFGLARAAEDRRDATPLPTSAVRAQTFGSGKHEVVSPLAQTHASADKPSPHAETVASADKPSPHAETIASGEHVALAATMASGEHPAPAPHNAESDDPEPTVSSGNALATPMTEVGALVGTPLYMAPEQHDRERGDARADQWSFCVSLWEGLFGAPPFVADNVEALAAAIKRGAPEPPDTSDVPEWIRRVLFRGLTVDKNGRYPSMEALLDALGRDPTAIRRKRVGLAAAVVLPVATASLAFAYAQTRRSEPAAKPALCTGGDAELAGVWDDQRRTEVANAFAATKSPLAAPAAAMVQQTLDHWRADYSRMHRDACEATHVRGTQSEDMLDRRMACLAARRHEVAALVDLLAKADAKLVEKSSEAALHAVDISACADLEALSAALPAPPPALASKIEGVRLVIAKAKALEETGRFPDGVTIARGAVTDARGLAYSPVVAEALARDGSLEILAGNYPEAEKQLFEAFYAAEALRYDDVGARVAIDLVDLMGMRRSRFEEAHRQARYAEAILTRHGGSDALWAHLENIEGNVFRAEGKLEEALTKQKSSLARFEKLYGPDNVDVARARLNLANVYGQHGDLANALTEFEHAQVVFTKALGDRHPAVALCHNNIGNVHYMKGEYDQALVEYRTAREIYEAALGPEHPDVAMARGNMALILHGTGKLKEAREEFLAAIAINEKAFGKDSPQVASDTTNLAMLYNDMERYGEAADALQRSLAIQLAQLGPAHPAVAFTRTELALALAHSGHARDAIPFAEQALAAGKEQPDNISDVEVARSEFALAFSLIKAKQDRPRALALAQSAHARLTAAGDGGKDELALLDEWYTKDVGKWP